MTESRLTERKNIESCATIDDDLRHHSLLVAGGRVLPDHAIGCEGVVKII